MEENKLFGTKSFKLAQIIGHVKPPDLHDNESFLSHSRSSISQQFNQVNFSKSKANQKLLKKQFGLSSILKAKQKEKNFSIKTEEIKSSRQNSITSFQSRQIVKLPTKVHENQTIQEKMQNFLINIKKIFRELKALSQIMLLTFEQIKKEMEINLIKVVNEIAKGNEVKSIEKIQQIIRFGFQSIKKNAVLPSRTFDSFKLLQSKELAQFKKNQRVKSNLYEPATPSIKPFKNPIQNSNSKHSFQIVNLPLEFASIQQIQKLNLKQMKQRIRAETERKNVFKIAQFEKPGHSVVDQQGEVQSLNQNQSTSNIEQLIIQMRNILST